MIVSNIFILGKSNLYPIALEASLKIKEVCYIHCEGFSSNFYVSFLDKKQILFYLLIIQIKKL